MRILHIEDDTEWFERMLRPRLEDSGRNVVLYARTLKEGEEILLREQVDYIVLDLAIPLDDPRASPTVAHGVALAVRVRADYPGTPILILTGQSSEEAAQELEEDDTFAVFWDGQSRNLVKIRKKSQLDRALDLVSKASADLQSLEAFELDCQDQDAKKLSVVQRRIVKLFGKHQGGAAARIKSLSGGLSDTSVLRISLLNQNGQVLVRALAKIGHWSLIAKEVENYRAYANRLPVGTCPAYMEEYSCGCHAIGGVFFQFATEYDRNFFDVLRNSDGEGAALVGELRSRLRIWHDAKNAQTTTVREIRQALCSDEKFAAISNRFDVAPWIEFERRDLRVNIAVGHGDLHGANILVSATGQPVVIDYADIGQNPSSLDPITLELSPFFHPSSREVFKGSPEIAQNWFHEERFKLMQFPETSRQLRVWSEENAFLNREVIAVVYAYCVRQLSYDGVDDAFARELIATAINKFAET